MYFGILVSFVILWTIYFFLNFFETGSGGDYYFYLYSYLVRVASRYFPLPDHLKPVNGGA